MTGLMDVTNCLGCGELFCGVGLCPDCTRFDEIYESRRVAKARMLAQQPRDDMGIIAYKPVEYPHLAPVLVVLAGVVVMTPCLLWATVHFGKLAILFLCGAK